MENFPCLHSDKKYLKVVFVLDSWEVSTSPIYYEKIGDSAILFNQGTNTRRCHAEWEHECVPKKKMLQN